MQEGFAMRIQLRAAPIEWSISNLLRQHHRLASIRHRTDRDSERSAGHTTNTGNYNRRQTTNEPRVFELRLSYRWGNGE